MRCTRLAAKLAAAAVSSLALSWPAAAQDSAAPPPPPVPSRLPIELPDHGSPAADLSTFRRMMPSPGAPAGDGEQTIAAAREALWQTRLLMQEQHSDLLKIRAEWAGMKAELAQAAAKPAMPEAPAPAAPPAVDPAFSRPIAQAPAPSSQAVVQAATVSVPAPTSTTTYTTFTGPGRVRHPGPLRRFGAGLGDSMVGTGSALQRLRDVKVIQRVPAPVAVPVSSTTTTTVTSQQLTTTQPIPAPAPVVQAATVSTVSASSQSEAATAAPQQPTKSTGIFRR